MDLAKEADWQAFDTELDDSREQHGNDKAHLARKGETAVIYL